MNSIKPQFFFFCFFCEDLIGVVRGVSIARSIRTIVDWNVYEQTNRAECRRTRDGAQLRIAHMLTAIWYH